MDASSDFMTIATRVLEFAKDYVEYCLSDEYHEDRTRDWNAYAMDTILLVVYGENVYEELEKKREEKEALEEIAELERRLTQLRKGRK